MARIYITKQEEIEIDTSLCDEEDAETYYDTMISSADQFLDARDI